MCFLLLGALAVVVRGRAADLAPSIPSVVVESFTAGGREQSLVMLPASGSGRGRSGAPPFRSYEPARLPVSAQALDFRIAPNSESVGTAARIQFRLEGWDEEWQDVEGMMWLSLRFVDENGNRISSASLPRAGQSRGWTGDPNTSPFRVWSETVIPPPRARQMQIFLTGGPPRTTGIWLVRGLRVVMPAHHDVPERVLLEERIERGNELQQPQGAPRDWRREGTNSSAPQVFTFTSSPQAHALALVDTDVRSSGRWVGGGRNIVKVESGTPIRIETEEAFSVGGGGSYTCSYHKIPAGRYTFRVIPVDEFGAQSGIGVQLPVVLVPPFYAAWWFWTIIAVVSATALTGGVRYATWKRLQRQLEQSERRRAVEHERIRIAQDIHDDMGARLTQISLASGLALRNTPPDSATHGDLKRLDRAAREVAIALDEIVWAVNPAHDTLEGLGNYISQYVTEITAETGLRCRLEIPALLPPRFISSGVRHHLLMALKEALNNALKHSGASEVRVQLAFVDPTLTLTIADNGTGFEPSGVPLGNGIANMRRRLAGTGGACELRSTPGQGTTVTFTLKLDATIPPPAMTA